jgi:hypothetical protein
MSIHSKQGCQSQAENNSATLSQHSVDTAIISGITVYAINAYVLTIFR